MCLLFDQAIFIITVSFISKLALNGFKICTTYDIHLLKNLEMDEKKTKNKNPWIRITKEINLKLSNRGGITFPPFDIHSPLLITIASRDSQVVEKGPQ